MTRFLFVLHDTSVNCIQTNRKFRLYDIGHNMAMSNVLHILHATEVELRGTVKRLTTIDVPETFAEKCQLVLESTVFVKALGEVKSVLDEITNLDVEKRESDQKHKLRRRETSNQFDSNSIGKQPYLQGKDRKNCWRTSSGMF